MLNNFVQHLYYNHEKAIIIFSTFCTSTNKISIFYFCILSFENMPGLFTRKRVNDISGSIKIHDIFYKLNQLHAVSRTWQCRQRKPSVMILFPTFRRILDCVLSGGARRRAVSTPERRNWNINLNKYFISSSRNRTRNQSCLQSHTCALCATTHIYSVVVNTKR